MGQAIEVGLTLLNSRKADYKNNGIQYYRPWMFLITDGAPTDNWESAASKVKEEETKKGLSFFAVGVQGAQMDILRRISVREPIALQGLKFAELFVWLSASQKSVSHSKLGDEVKLPVPTGWAAV